MRRTSTENSQRGRWSAEPPHLSSQQPSKSGHLTHFTHLPTNILMCLVASSRSPFHKWDDGGWSDSLSSFPAHTGSCLRNSKVFFYLQNLLILNIAQTVREKQCPEISSVPHSCRFGRNNLRKPSKGSW